MPTRSSSYSIRPCPSCGFTIAEGSQHGARSQRVEELLRSNESPQDSERVSLAGFVADGRRRLGVLDSQISLARQVLDALAQDRQELQRDIEDHQIILNPARRIPEEILRQFFLACVEEDTDTPVMPSTTLDSHHLPWTLAQVSSRWRAIAISFPRLWATICITLTADDLARPEVCQRLQLHLGAQLHRSSSYALSIWLNFLCDIPASHPLLHILLPSSPRWKYLFLRARSLSTFAGLSRIKGFLQSLESVDLRIVTSSSSLDLEDTAGSALRDIFEFAPHLRTIAGNAHILHTSRLPWFQISTFAGTTATKIEFASTPSQQLRILRLMPNLAECVLRCPRADRESVHLDVVSCSRMRSLVLWDVAEPPGTLLEYLKLPALESLSYNGSTASLRSFIGRSHAPLKHLRYISGTLTASHSLDLLAALPSLQTFSSSSPYVFSETFFGVLLSRPSLAPFLELIVSESPLPQNRDILDAFEELRVARTHLRLTVGKPALWEIE